MKYCYNPITKEKLVFPKRKPVPDFIQIKEKEEWDKIEDQIQEQIQDKVGTTEKIEEKVDIVSILLDLVIEKRAPTKKEQEVIDKYKANPTKWQ